MEVIKYNRRIRRGLLMLRVREFVHESKRKIETPESRMSYHCFFVKTPSESICPKHKSFCCFSKVILKETDVSDFPEDNILCKTVRKLISWISKRN